MFPSIKSGIESIREAVTTFRQSLDTLLGEMAREILQCRKINVQLKKVT